MIRMLLLVAGVEVVVPQMSAWNKPRACLNWRKCRLWARRSRIRAADAAVLGIFPLSAETRLAGKLARLLPLRLRATTTMRRTTKNWR